ncbi:MAG: TolC family protein [Pigmentiphaga sp.]|nr:TolC family protein [Pigmentiphaga sp.]
MVKPDVRLLSSVALVFVTTLAGCANPHLAPASPTTPWTPEALPDARPLQLTSLATAEAARPAADQARNADGAPTPARAAADPRFDLPTIAAAGHTPAPPTNLPSHPLSLPELIDLAQRHNPATRVAWEQARQAAQAVGIAEALFLPQTTAVAVAGYQRSKVPLPLALGGIDHVDTSISGVIPAITLQWLLFDFGEREAIAESARQLAFGANVQFQAAHQLLIQAVALAYYPYEAARSRTAIAAEALRNSESVAQAVSERRRAGLATIVEESQARQMVAQARLGLVEARGLERDAYQALVAAVGLPPTTRFEVARLPLRPLPDSLAADVEDRLDELLARRPEVLAAYTAAQAAQHGIDAAEAAFLPKVFLAGIAAITNNRLDISGLSLLGQPVSRAGVMVGVSLPLYDGGLRSNRLAAARSQADQAIELWRQTQQAAALDLVTANNRLRSALEAHAAATEWVETAQVLYDGALEAYRHGLGTVTVATEATNGLLAARMAQIDALAATRVAATLLAHATGQLTAADDVP